MSIRSYPRGSQVRIQPNFRALEFDCACDDSKCKTTQVDDDLVLALQLIHDKTGGPVHVLEGYRCAKRQQWLRDQRNADGTPKYQTAIGRSPHEDGRAADIKTYIHPGHELEAFAAQAGVKAIGVGKRFIHIDMRRDKTRRWTYPY